MTATIYTGAIGITCPHPACWARVGERCNAEGFHQARINAAAKATREANRAARSS